MIPPTPAPEPGIGCAGVEPAGGAAASGVPFLLLTGVCSGIMPGRIWGASGPLTFTKEEHDMPNAYDQEVKHNHRLCWDDGRDETPTWWFDNGELCKHPEWHE